MVTKWLALTVTGATAERFMKKVVLALIDTIAFLLIILLTLSGDATWFVIYGLPTILLGPFFLIGSAIDRLIVKNRGAFWAAVSSVVAAGVVSLPVLAYDGRYFYILFLPALVTILSGCFFSRLTRNARSRVIRLISWLLHGSAAGGVGFIIMMLAI
jgi:hypothetical protein